MENLMNDDFDSSSSNEFDSEPDNESENEPENKSNMNLKRKNLRLINFLMDLMIKNVF